MTSPADHLEIALAGRYDLQREVGAGGMATVWLAHDLRHGRDVAIKVLHPDLGAALGGDRFLTEIRTTARLQHPHILPLLDSGEADGLLYYVMPYVAGESLRDRLAREKQLPIEDAVQIAREVADALGHAHGHGIVHRDIKPENILLQGGHALVADFGIALAVQTAAGQRMTQTGLSLGTPQYMSPEQAMGEKAIDARSDIYALGAVTYEMLTGEPPFTGATVQAVVAKVLSADPERPTLMRRTIPPHVEGAVLKALAKLPADRYADAGRFATALGSADQHGSTAIAHAGVRAAGGSRRRVAPAAAFLALGAVALWGWLRPPPTGSPALVTRFVVTPPQAQPLNTGLGGVAIAISPDGSTLVYTGGGVSDAQRLYVRTLADTVIRPLVGTEGGMRPFFSHDGQWVAFISSEGLMRVPAAGGPAARIVPGVPPVNFYGGSWSEDGRILYSSAGNIYLVPATGGTPTVLLKGMYRWPEFLPDGRRALVTRFETLAGAMVEVLDIDTGQTSSVLPEGTNPHYVAPGYLVYADRRQFLMAAPFNASTATVTGDAVPLGDVLVRIGGAAMFAVSRQGTAALVGAKGSGVGALVLAEAQTGREVLVDSTAEHWLPRFAPDGRRIASEVARGGAATDLFVTDLETGGKVRLSLDGSVRYPTWSPDGRLVAGFSQDSASIMVFDASGGGAPREIAKGLGLRRTPIDWMPDGRGLLVQQGLGEIPGLYILPFAADSSPRLMLPAANFRRHGFALSPDGRWVAFSSTEGGERQVFVSPMDGSGARQQVSVEGAIEPVWAPDGRRLYYRTGSHLIAANVVTAPAFAVTSRDTILADPYAADDQWLPSYDVHPDGKRFIYIRAGAPATSITVTVNWVEELRRRMAGETSPR